jgi:hypothetical protein
MVDLVYTQFWRKIENISGLRKFSSSIIMLTYAARHLAPFPLYPLTPLVNIAYAIKPDG